MSFNLCFLQTCCRQILLQILEPRQEMLMKEIHPCEWKVLLYTYDGSTVGKRIWLAAQVADKLACKCIQTKLLESDNVSVAAENTIIRLHTIPSAYQKISQAMLQSCPYRVCRVVRGSLTSLVHIQLGFVWHCIAELQSHVRVHVAVGGHMPHRCEAVPHLCSRFAAVLVPCPLQSCGSQSGNYPFPHLQFVHNRNPPSLGNPGL